MIRNRQELKAAVRRVDDDLQAIQDYLGRKDDPGGRVRFPRGYIHTAADFRRHFWFVRDENLRRNLSYSLMLWDVHKWLIRRTDLSGQAQEMLFKTSICLLGSLAESLTKDALRGEIGRKAGFKKRTEKMILLKMITPELKSDLDWLWDTRNNEHLFLLTIPEYGHYSASDYTRASKTIVSLTSALNEYFRNLETPF